MAADAQSEPTGPTLGAEEGLEKGPGIDCMRVVNRQERGSH
jgi:hypothetical protein